MEHHQARPLHLCRVDTKSIILNRSHMLIHAIALCTLIYYRASFLFFANPRPDSAPATKPTILSWSLIFFSELMLSFLWLLNQAYRWRPVLRTAFPERLPEDDKLPAIDVFVCTADPNKEPTLDVMNTVVSAMALNYPPEKLHVYLSDDGGSSLTLFGMREAYEFARCWLPFCNRYGVRTRCPKAYFQEEEDDRLRGVGSHDDDDYVSQKKKVKEKYDQFTQRIAEQRNRRDNHGSNAWDHPSNVEVVLDPSTNKSYETAEKCGWLKPRVTLADVSNQSYEWMSLVIQGSTSEIAAREDEWQHMPLLVYVAREKRPSYHHHFKAGALNVLLRVSGVISNSPYILVLDCDMYCNDPASARQAMCFHMDSEISPSLSFVQFPQRFHTINDNDIYDSKVRSVFWIKWYGMDGLKGPVVSGTGFYMKRQSLYWKPKQNGTDAMGLRALFGHSSEFIKYLQGNDKPKRKESPATGEKALLLASCGYETGTKWGQKVGFLYHSVVEDYFTSFNLHCKGWSSVYYSPPRPQFLGTSTTNLNAKLTQGTRWSTGLTEVGFSRFCPIVYGPLRMPILQSMCYAELAFFPLYCLPLWCFATIPQICLLNGISIFPEVSSSYSKVFFFIFLSSLFAHLREVVLSGHSVWTFTNEQRIWMIQSITCHLYGTLDAILKQIGLRKSSFSPTNKDIDGEQSKRYKMGMFDFQASAMFLVPMVTLVVLNMVALVGGVARVVVQGGWEKLLAQLGISVFILMLSYPIIEGMVLRTDKGRIPSSITALSTTLALALLLLGSLILIY